MLQSDSSSSAALFLINKKEEFLMDFDKKIGMDIRPYVSSIHDIFLVKSIKIFFFLLIKKYFFFFFCGISIFKMKTGKICIFVCPIIKTVSSRPKNQKKKFKLFYY